MHALNVAGQPTYIDAQTAINAAYKRTGTIGAPCYVFGADFILGGPWTVTDRQPSRYRGHWRVNPDGTLWVYDVPRGPGTVPEEITYQQIT